MEFKLTGEAAVAAMLAVPLLILALVMAALTALALGRLHWDLEASSATVQTRASPPLPAPVAMAAALTLALAVGAPLASLLWNGLSITAWSNLRSTVLGVQILNSLAPSVLAAATATVTASVLAVAGERWLRSWRSLLYGGALVAFAAPPTLYAIGVGGLASHGPWGSWLPGTQLPTAFANAARWLPLALLMTASALRLADRTAEDSARLEGDTDLRAPLRITLFPAAQSLVGAGLLVFAFSLGDVAMTSLLYPPGGQTLAVAIFDAMHYAHEPEVAAVCLCLLTLVSVPTMAGIGVWRQATR